MTWGPGAPATPTAHNNITVPFYVTNVQEPLLHARGMLPDPGAVDTALVATGIGAAPTAIWKKIPGSTLAAGAAVTNIGYTPANAAGQAFSGAISAPSMASAGAVTAGTNITANGALTVLGTFNGGTLAGGAVNIGTVNAGAGGVTSTGGGTFAGALAAASAAITAAITAATATMTGLCKARTFESTVSDGATSPFTIHANQANIPVPNLKAALATLADNSSLLNGHAEAALSVASAATATSATTATTATNATQLGGFAAALFSRFEIGTYAGSGGGVSTRVLVASTLPRWMIIMGTNAGGDSVTFWLASTTASQNVRSGSSGGTPTQGPPSVTRLNSVIGGYNVSGADGSDTSGYTYNYIAFW